MSDKVRKYYDKRYAEGRSGKIPGGILGWMFLRLRKFEVSRISATYELLDKGKRILDLGVGGGKLLGLCKKRRKYEEFYGLDISSVVVKRAKRTVKELSGNLSSVFIKRADINDSLPYKAKWFDTVTCIATLEHIFDPYYVISEIKRVLKPGGALILEVPNLTWLPRRFSVVLGKLPVTADEEGWDGGHLHYFTFEETEKLLREYGFEIEYEGSSGIFASIRNLWPSMLGGNIIIKARIK